jgi:hypothetical protein
MARFLLLKFSPMAGLHLGLHFPPSQQPGCNRNSSKLNQPSASHASCHILPATENGNIETGPGRKFGTVTMFAGVPYIYTVRRALLVMNV